MATQNLISMLKKHEGYRANIYKDTRGFDTVGYGHKVTSPEEYSKGVSEAEAEAMLVQDADRARADAERVFPNLSSYPSEKQDAFVNMTFNLGASGVLGFKNMHTELQKGDKTDWDVVGQHMYDSKWREQVGDRSTELIDIIKKKEEAEAEVKEEADSFEKMKKDYGVGDSFERMQAEYKTQQIIAEDQGIDEDYLLPVTAAISASSAFLFGLPAGLVAGGASLITEAGSAILGKFAKKVDPALEFPVYFASQVVSAFSFENWLINNTVKKLATAAPKFWTKEFAVAERNGWLSKEFISDTSDIVRNMDMGTKGANKKLLNLYKQQAYDYRLGKVGKRLEKLEKVPSKVAEAKDVITQLSKKKTLLDSDYRRLARIAKEDAYIEYMPKFNKFKNNAVNKAANEKWQALPTRDLVEALRADGGIPKNYKFVSPEVAEAFAKRHPDLLSKTDKAAQLESIARGFDYESVDDVVLSVFNTPNKKQLRRIASAELKSDFDKVFINEISSRVAAKEADYLYELHGKTKGWKAGRISKQKHIEATRRSEGKLPAKLVAMEVKAGKRATSKLLEILQKTTKKDITHLQRAHAQKLAEFQAAVRVERKLKVINRRLQRSIGIDGEYGAQLDKLLAPLYNKAAGRPAEHMWKFLTRKYYDEVSIGADILIKRYNDLLQTLPFTGRTFLDLTYNQAKDLDNFVRAFKFVAENDRWITRIGEKYRLKHLVSEIYNTAKTTIPKAKLLQPRVTGSQLEELSRGSLGKLANARESLADVAGGALASLKRIEPICIQLDGFKNFGPAWKNIFNRTVQAETAKEALGSKVFGKYEEIFAAHKAATGLKPSKYWTATSGNLNGLAINKETAVLMALNSKHPNNMEAMLSGLRVSKEAMINFLDGAMSTADKKLVNDVLDTLDELYPLLAEIYKKKTGLVLPRPEGGRYFPILRDSNFSNISESIDDVFLDTGSDLFYTEVKKTFMKARVGGVKAVKLDFRGLTQHLADIVHYATHWEALNDIQKITKNAKFKEAVESSMGKGVYQQFDPWIKNMARPSRTKIDTFMGKARRNVTFASLAFVPKIAVKQTLSFVTAMPEIGYGNAIKAVKDFARRPREIRDAIAAASPEMANRSKTWNRDLIELMSEMTESGTKATLMKAGFLMIHKVDEITASVVWHGGYEQGLKLFKGNAELAVNHANRLVRKTQPASSAKDTPRIMRSGEGWRAVSMFYSYWSVFHNQVGEVVAKGLSGKMSATETIGTLAWLTIAPAVAQQLTSAAWNTLTGREQEIEHGKEVATGAALNAIGGLPVLRDIGASALSGFDYQVSPIVAAPKAASSVIKTPFKLFDDEAEFSKYDAESAAKMLSYFTIFPSKAAITAVEGALRIYEDDTDDYFELIDRPPYEK